MKCKYCGQSAGFLKSEHKECREAVANGKKYICEYVDYIYKCRDCIDIKDVIKSSAKRYYISEEEMKALLLDSWCRCAKKAFDRDFVAEDVSILVKMLNALNISRSTAKESKEGKKLFEYSENLIMQEFSVAVSNKDIAPLKFKVYEIAKLYAIEEQSLKNIVMASWAKVLDFFLDDGIFDAEEEAILRELGELFEFSDADCAPYKERIVKGAVLRDIFEGNTPKRIEVNGYMPVMLQKQESIIWIFNDVECYEDKIRRHYVGGSAGVSVRVAKGVYVRSGSFKGYPVETSETVCLGSGSFIITNKHIFWTSSSKSIKIPIKKLLAVHPCSEGVILQKDGVTAKPQTFVTDDPWFTYNLISNLNLL